MSRVGLPCATSWLIAGLGEQRVTERVMRQANVWPELWRRPPTQLWQSGS
jgi:hypothetical protein